MEGLPALEGGRIRLVPSSPEHAGRYHAWMQDGYLLRMTGTDAGFTVEDVRAVLRDCGKDPGMAHFFIYAKDAPEGAGPIGDADLRGIEPGSRAECAIMIGDPASRGKGYAKEALRLLLGYGFGALGLKKVTAAILPFNGPSMGLHKGLGFREAGRDGDDVILELERSCFAG
jgi:RimJ/RimL family protein N-acetyltransferase